MSLGGLAKRIPILVFALAIARDAHADDCASVRPTDPGGYFGIGYGADPVASYDTPEGRVRVWYATSGSQAPKAIDAAKLSGQAVETAIDGYAAMGFLPALGDGDYPLCSSNGGDGRMDVYLVGMGGADGQAATEICTQVGDVSRCTGFILADNLFEEDGYASFEEGALTVLPHELFHLVQNAYSADIDRWWAEGTAQWATKALHPELTDLERFLPAYFSDTTRSIDAPPGGVVQSFLYATAIWPVFLSERHGPTVVREIMEAIASDGSKVLQATDHVLIAKGSSLAAEFTTFATWNAATGDRAGSGGYPLSATYPMVKTEVLSADIGASSNGVTSGLAAHYYEISAGAARIVSIDTDPARNAAVALPLEAAHWSHLRANKRGAVDGENDGKRSPPKSGRTGGHVVVLDNGRADGRAAGWATAVRFSGGRRSRWRRRSSATRVAFGGPRRCCDKPPTSRQVD
ncbi:Hypothetical protein A7982_00821 [Minicystis rosea]|nr:Hypothetical protein A7982_00821 [Minicystis rosea]